jgi:hypothetical protein
MLSFTGHNLHSSIAQTDPGRASGSPLAGPCLCPGSVLQLFRQCQYPLPSLQEIRPPADAASIYRICSARLSTDPDAPNIAVLPNHVAMRVGVAVVEGQVEFVREFER